MWGEALWWTPGLLLGLALKSGNDATFQGGLELGVCLNLSRRSPLLLKMIALSVLALKWQKVCAYAKVQSFPWGSIWERLHVLLIEKRVKFSEGMYPPILWWFLVRSLGKPCQAIFLALLCIAQLSSNGLMHKHEARLL